MGLPLAAVPVLWEIGKDVLDRFFPDKEKQREFEAEMTARLSSQEAQARLAQIEVNKQEAAHSSVFVAGWRPFIGWVCGAGFAWMFVGQPLAIWAAALWHPGFVPPALPSEHLLELTLGMLGLGALRSWEKSKGVAR